MIEKFNFETNWYKLKCLLPVYDRDGGNSTEVWLMEGDKVIIPNKTKTVLKKLAQVFALDVTQLKKKYGKLVGRKTSTPLPFHPELVLIPFKYREPLVKDEGSRGYIVKSRIKSIISLPDNNSQIVFSDNTSLKCLQSVNSIKLTVTHAEIVAKEFYKNYQVIRENEDIYRVVNALLSTLKNNSINY